jgi:uncharacterized protein with HEPN domain
MMSPSLRLRDYRQHMLSAIGQIGNYTAGMGRDAFMRDAKTQDAVLRNLQVIGEAAHNIRRRHPDFVAANPEVPWRSAYGMRNAVTHGYFAIDLDQIWTTVEADLSPLAARLRELLSTLPSDPSEAN